MAESKTTETIPGVGCTWEELEIVDHSDGHQLFKASIRRRAKSGKTEEIEEIRARLPRPIDLAKARVECRNWCAELKVDSEKDCDVFGELEQLCILAHCIRTKTSPYPQAYTAQELATKFDESSLLDLLGKVNALKTATDPRESLATEDDVWRLVHSVAAAGHLLPLTDIAGHEHPSFLLFMAQQAVLSPIAVAWRRSHESLIPDRSPNQNSVPSSADNTGR